VCVGGVVGPGADADFDNFMRLRLGDSMGRAAASSGQHRCV